KILNAQILQLKGARKSPVSDTPKNKRYFPRIFFLVKSTNKGKSIAISLHGCTHSMSCHHSIIRLDLYWFGANCRHLRPPRHPRYERSLLPCAVPTSYIYYAFPEELLHWQILPCPPAGKILAPRVDVS